jgi:hypothetical protein
MMNFYHGRTSIEKLTEIDIMQDSVIDICDKLFARCTEGKTIDYATDSPMPNTVNPLSVEEATEWSETSMKVKLMRVSASPKRRGKVVISRTSRSTQRSSATPFFGYVSEPPTADGFKADQPIGPAAKALKAAGILTAVAKHQGKPTTSYVDLFSSTWGNVTEETMSYVTPDLSTSSSKDLIKFVRSSNHCLFGFNSNAPAVSVDMGRYRPETMVNNYQFDWHAISLTMRFIGEFISKYNIERLPVDSVLYMAPAYEEGKVYKVADLTVPVVNLDQRTPCEAVMRISRNTMKYYAANMKTYGVASMVRSIGRNIAIMADPDATAAMVRAIQSKISTKRTTLPKAVGKTVSKGIIGEVHSAKRPAFRDVLSKAVNDRKLSYFPTWRSVHTFVWASAFKSTFERDELLRSLLRKKSLWPTYSEAEQQKVLEAMARSVPDGLGHSIITMLTSMLPDKDRAVTQFAEMIMTLSGEGSFTLNSSYESMYTAAIASSRNAEEVFQAIQAGYTRAEQDTHSAGSFMDHLVRAGDIHSRIVIAIENFMRDRLTHWSRHYASRMIDCQAILKSMKVAVRARGIKTGLKSSLGPTLALDHTVSALVSTYMAMDPSDLIAAVEEAKADAVMYAFLSAGYRYATVKVSNELKMSVELRAGDLREILKKSTANYARKRKTWAPELRTAAMAWDEGIKKLDRITRATDMLNHCDESLEPVVKWTWMYTKLLTRYGTTSKAIDIMIQRHVFPNLHSASEAEFDDPIVVARKEPVTTKVSEQHVARVSNNPYAALDCYSSSDESDEESVGIGAPGVTVIKSVEENTTMKDERLTNEDATAHTGLRIPDTGAMFVRDSVESTPVIAATTTTTAAPSIMSIRARLMSSAMASKVETTAVDANATTSALYSLRVAIESSDTYKFNEDAFKEYLNSINVTSNDHRVPFTDLNTHLVGYNVLSKESFRASEKAMSAFLGADNTDIS